VAVLGSAAGIEGSETRPTMKLLPCGQTILMALDSWQSAAAGDREPDHS
jgi:hypothetical protein